MKRNLRLLARLTAWLACMVLFESASVAAHVPCKVTQKVKAVFPSRLLYDGVLRGEVLVAIEVSETGRLSDTLVIASTHPLFTDAALAAVRGWEFTPGSRDGQPLISRLDVSFEFEVRGVVVTEKRLPADALDSLANERFAQRPYRAGELDQPVRAVRQVAPLYPRQWIKEGRRGSIVIEFYIDENGVPRMPLSVSRGDEGLIAAAIAALKEWRFAPPLREGKPVLVRAQQLFVFQPPPDPA